MSTTQDLTREIADELWRSLKEGVRKVTAWFAPSATSRFAHPPVPVLVPRHRSEGRDERGDYRSGATQTIKAPAANGASRSRAIGRRLNLCEGTVGHRRRRIVASAVDGHFRQRRHAESYRDAIESSSATIPMSANESASSNATADQR